MFKNFREAQSNKREILRYKAFLLGTISEVVLKYKQSQEAIKESGISEKDAVDIMNKIKGLDQKEIVSVLVDTIKAKSGE